MSHRQNEVRADDLVGLTWAEARRLIHAVSGADVRCARLVGPDDRVTEDQAELLLQAVRIATAEDAEAAGYRAPKR
jgi:hypothetical protein